MHLPAQSTADSSSSRKTTDAPLAWANHSRDRFLLHPASLPRRFFRARATYTVPKHDAQTFTFEALLRRRVRSASTSLPMLKPPVLPWVLFPSRCSQHTRACWLSPAAPPKWGPRVAPLAPRLSPRSDHLADHRVCATLTSEQHKRAKRLFHPPIFQSAAAIRKRISRAGAIRCKQQINTAQQDVPSALVGLLLFTLTYPKRIPEYAVKRP